MERLRLRDEEWAWALRQRSDSNFWVSVRGLMSERGEMENEITREAVGRELQSSKQWVLYNFFFTRILAWFKVGFGLIQPFFGLFLPVSTVGWYNKNQGKSAQFNTNRCELARIQKKKKPMRHKRARSRCCALHRVRVRRLWSCTHAF